MIRKSLGVALMLGMLCLPALAQKAEVFAGFQYTHLDPSWNAAGWNASLTGNFNRWFGVTGDFSGAYKSGTKFHTYTFGPVISAGKGPISPFVHFLVGGGTASGAGSTSGLVMMAGGGIDVGGGHHGIAFRLVQADWMLTRFSGVTDKKNARISTGIALRF